MYTINFQVGLIIESAAVETFSKVFKNVKSSEFSQSSNLVITVSGDQLRSLGWGVLESDITATVSLATGKKIGEYYATGRYGGPFYKINDSKGLEALYVKAFVQILEAMLKDQRLAKYFENGFGEIQTANLTGRQPTPQPQKIATAPQEQTPQSGTGSGFFVSKMGHVITNAHVVKGCKKITIGDNANKQVPAELINIDRSNDLALLKLSTLEMASAESKSLIQKLNIAVVPLSSKGLLRSEDVKLGEKVLVAGYPFGELFSNTIKVTSGIVSATRGAGDDTGQFQLDAAVQPGNSGGPVYDSSGNIVGVVVAQLDKLKMAKAIGSMPENVNFGIKASTVKQFLISSGLPSKKAEQTEEKPTEQLAEIAKNQALMVMCLQ
jgi:S1-C subfamily serine protease